MKYQYVLVSFVFKKKIIFYLIFTWFVRKCIFLILEIYFKLILNEIEMAHSQKLC